MKKRLFALLLSCLLLTGCTLPGQQTSKRYNATFLDVFDTVTTIVGFAESEEAFTQTARTIHDELLHYHQLFDIYNSYDGVTNLKSVNDAAGQPVQVDEAILQLLKDCKEYYALSGGRVNVAMGSVLQLWHEARQDAYDDPQNAYLPDMEKLLSAAQHTSMDELIVDEEHSTVQITDPFLSLDVGAVAKGWAAQKVAQNAPEGLLISVGGNVCATGPKPDGSDWTVGIQNPDGGDKYLHTVSISRGCVVTSGDYQRTYPVDGKLYHHIIDPDTLYPGRNFRSVTVICQDSGVADALSTALFLLPLEEGKALVKQCGAEAMWVHPDGRYSYSDGFQKLIRT